MKDLLIGITAGMVAGVALATNPKVKCLMDKAKSKMNCRCTDSCECHDEPLRNYDEMNID